MVKIIGSLISKIRKEKGLSKTELAKLTQINVGHITHIEKGERNPSHKTLKNICNALEVPYEQLLYSYDKKITDDHKKYGFINLIPYDKVLAVDNINGLIDCPHEAPNSSIALKMNDNSMEPLIEEASYVFVEFNHPLDNKDIGVFCYNDEIFIRRFFSRKGKITLKAESKKFNDITIDFNDDFYIIGRVYV